MTQRQQQLVLYEVMRHFAYAMVPGKTAADHIEVADALLALLAEIEMKEEKHENT